MTNIKKTNREHVIECAATLFFEKGFVYTSMDDIVHISTVSKSNVYYHFSNKNDLLEAVFDFWIETYQENLKEALSQSNQTVEQRMLHFLEGLSVGIERRDYQGGCPFITLAIQSPNELPFIKEKTGTFFSNLSIACEALILEGIRNGEFRESIDAKEIAELFITNMEGALFLAEIKKDNHIVISTAMQLFKLLV